MRSGRVLLLGAAAVAAAVAGALPTAADATAGRSVRAGNDASASPVVVVSGLNNPRQLSFARGHLYIAEAGNGGTTKVEGPQGPSFIGDSGSVSRVTNPARAHGRSPNRVVTGLISAAGEDGSFAVGPDGVSMWNGGRRVWIAQTYVPPDVLSAPLGSAQDGKLLGTGVYATHSATVVADITGYERDNDPDRKGFDSNPYAVLATRRGEYVADAAGNDILFVNRKHQISTFHVFKNVLTGDCRNQADPDPAHPGCNFVPTSLAKGRHGHIYVGGLSSETPGAAQVVELDRHGVAVQKWSGFTSVTGVAAAPDGSLYVSQLEAQETDPPFPMVVGQLTKVAPDGTRTSIDVPFPAGVVLDRRGNVYVSAWSGSPAAGLAGPGTDGQVWRLRF